MQTFSPVPLDFGALAKKSVQHWWPSFKLCWPFIAALIIFREYYCPSCLIILHPKHPALELAINFLLIIVNLTIWMGICALVYRSFLPNARSGLRQQIWVLLKRAPWLLLVLLMYSLFVSLSGFIGYGLGSLVMHYAAPASPFLKVIPLMIGFPMIYTVVLLLYVMPLFVINTLSFWGAFKYGARIVYHHWFRAFFAYAVIVLFFVSLRGLYLLQVALGNIILVNLAIDLLAFMVLIPIVTNLFILVMRDLELREAA